MSELEVKYMGSQFGPRLFGIQACWSSRWKKYTFEEAIWPNVDKTRWCCASRTARPEKRVVSMGHLNHQGRRLTLQVHVSKRREEFLDVAELECDMCGAFRFAQQCGQRGTLDKPNHRISIEHPRNTSCPVLDGGTTICVRAAKRKYGGTPLVRMQRLERELREQSNEEVENSRADCLNKCWQELVVRSRAALAL